ncbi:MAG: hypothetical protein ABFS12_12755 [Bacteroidota bacterium]
MATKAPSPVKPFSDSTVEKQVYSLVDSFAEFIPLENDRYRLGYGLVKYLEGNGDAPEILIKSTKLEFENISLSELAQRLTNGLSKIK